MQLTNRTVLITGGTRGIGFALAGALVRRGNTVLVTGRDPGGLAEVRRALPGVHAFQSDARDPDAIRTLRDRVTAEFPSLDVVVNNAGVMRNLDTSGLAVVPYPLSPVYSAAKAGLHAFTRVLRAQLAGTGVRVVELAPPPVETALFRGEFAEATKRQKAMDPAVFAARAVAAIEAGRLEIRPGLSNALKVASRVAPEVAFRQLAREVLPKRAGAHPSTTAAGRGAGVRA